MPSLLTGHENEASSSRFKIRHHYLGLSPLQLRHNFCNSLSVVTGVTWIKCVVSPYKQYVNGVFSRRSSTIYPPLTFKATCLLFVSGLVSIQLLATHIVRASVNLVWSHLPYVRQQRVPSSKETNKVINNVTDIQLNRN